VVRLRGFQKRDLAGLHQLDQVCFPPEIAYSRDELRYFLTNPRCSCWIAEEPENGLAGFVIVERASRRGRATGHVVTLDVEPSCRRHGVGKLLMQTAQDALRLEGTSVMSLEVAEDNASARQFYRNLGFVAIGRIEKYYGGKIDAEVMEKAI
jgi:[ribosomal protein S18]-alanine N-acetyltransferase